MKPRRLSEQLLEARLELLAKADAALHFALGRNAIDPNWKARAMALLQQALDGQKHKT